MREMDDHGGKHIHHKTENLQLDKVKKIWGRYVSQGSEHDCSGRTIVTLYIPSSYWWGSSLWSTLRLRRLRAHATETGTKPIFEQLTRGREHDV